MKYKHHEKRRGYTLVEVVLAAAILTILARALVEASVLMGRLTSAGNVQTVMQLECEKAFDSIVTDLRRSGFVTVNEKEFPYVFDNGNPEEPFLDHEHDRAYQDAVNGDLDFGAMREIVFVQPADDDGDERPDITEDGLLSWSIDEVSYVVNTHDDGNFLERRINGVNPKRVARHIERIVFDTPESSNWEIPLGSVRVQIFLRMRDPDGALAMYSNSVVLTLRNGGIE